MKEYTRCSTLKSELKLQIAEVVVLRQQYIFGLFLGHHHVFMVVLNALKALYPATEFSRVE